MTNGRKSIAKSIRFEVFKRDKFKCQYCGKSAPDILLVIDHIKPVASGGNNEILNLITSCEPCNAGKSDKSLDDDSAIQKQRTQLEALQERRDQLEMMMNWMEGLRDIKNQSLERVCKYWDDLTPGFSLTDHGKKSLRRWMSTYGVQEVIAAMDTSAEQYLAFEKDGNVTKESCGIAFKKIQGICRVNRDSKDEPDLKDIYYIRGILRNRLSYLNEQESVSIMREARYWQVPMSDLRQYAKDCSSWTRFCNWVNEAIDEQKKRINERFEQGEYPEFP